MIMFTKKKVPPQIRIHIIFGVVKTEGGGRVYKSGSNINFRSRQARNMSMSLLGKHLPTGHVLSQVLFPNSMDL